MNTIRNLTIGLVLMAFAGAVPLLAIAADDPEARAIMERVDARDEGDNQTGDMQMVLIDKRGQQRVRRIATFKKPD